MSPMRSPTLQITRVFDGLDGGSCSTLPPEFEGGQTESADGARSRSIAAAAVIAEACDVDGDGNLDYMEFVEQFEVQGVKGKSSALSRLIYAEEDRLGYHDGAETAEEIAAAQAAGGAKAALEITVDYAKTREQFGKPLGAFQSVSHYLADAATQIEGGSTLV